MKNYNGIAWGTLLEEEKKQLLKNAYFVDSMCNPVKNGLCIVDLTEKYSIAGIVVDGEIIIRPEALIYCPNPEDY